MQMPQYSPQQLVSIDEAVIDDHTNIQRKGWSLQGCVCWNLGCWVWWSQQGVMLIKLGNRWPRVKPGELDQTDGNFSSVIHQQIHCWSGYIMRIHDIITTRLYHYRLASILLSDDATLMWYDDMVQNILTVCTEQASCMGRSILFCLHLVSMVLELDIFEGSVNCERFIDLLHNHLVSFIYT